MCHSLLASLRAGIYPPLSRKLEQPLESLPHNYLSEITKLLDGLDARPRPTHSPRGLANRGELGDFTSIICFQAAVRGLEDILGPEGASVVLIRAGRLRGQALVDDWGVGHLRLPTEKIGLLLDAALGHDGTRLCAVRGIQDDGQAIQVQLAETICSATYDSEPPAPDRHCTFTLGAVWGALEALTGEQYDGKQVRYVLRGDPCDQFTFKRL